LPDRHKEVNTTGLKAIKGKGVFAHYDWFSSPQGNAIRVWEHQVVHECIADIFGYNALQIGDDRADFLTASRIPLRVHCGGLCGAVRAQPEMLPFASASVDLVILPHVLEFSSHPHQVLREIERVLLPEGHLLILGFNPWSLFGARRWLAQGMNRMGMCALTPPWACQPLSLLRLKDWLALLSFETHLTCLGPPLFSSRPQNRACAGAWGTVYLLHAIKKVHGMRLLRPEWQAPRRGVRNWVSAVPRQWPSPPAASEKDVLL
jgi:SAM-dependent methyltransferase